MAKLENPDNPYEMDVGRKPAGTPADASAFTGKAPRRIVQGKQAALQDQKHRSAVRASSKSNLRPSRNNRGRRPFISRRARRCRIGQ